MIRICQILTLQLCYKVVLKIQLSDDHRVIMNKTSQNTRKKQRKKNLYTCMLVVTLPIIEDFIDEETIKQLPRIQACDAPHH